MKRALLGTTALIGASLCAAAPAAAESPIRLSVGGFFRTAYMLVLDDDDSLPENAAPEPGDEKTDDGVFSDAEIHFVGRTVLDNGLEVGGRVELEGEDNSGANGDQIDEAWLWFAGGFGEIRIGSDDEALANSCILPPGGTANFSAFSPNQWGANSLSSFPFGNVSNSACTGVDDRSDAQKIIYFSPLFHGFQLSASYTPNPDVERHGDGGGPHLGMPPKSALGDEPDADADASVYLTYSHQGRNWGLTWGGGASWEMGTDDSQFTDFKDQDFYQTGLTIDIGRFSIGGVFEYYHDLNSFESLTVDFTEDLNAWVAGGGLAYNYRAWTFGAQYAYRQDTFRRDFGVGDDLKIEQVQQRAVATVNYALGPGINLDGQVGYTWRDFDPENEFFAGDDDYDGLEFGIGSAVSF